jgi:hypothetical protein
MSLDSRAPGLTAGASTYSRLHDVVEDVDGARELIGFHFRNSTLEGSSLGRAVGRYAAGTYFQPVR